MHTIIHPMKPARTRSLSASAKADVRQPHYDCREQGDALKVVVYVPGVDAVGVEITTRGPDLMITARKSHVVRVNWQSAHLEGAQRDYQLKLRLGTGLDYEALEAEIHDGVLTVTLPKKSATTARHAAREPLQSVA